MEGCLAFFTPSGEKAHASGAVFGLKISRASSLGFRALELAGCGLGFEVSCRARAGVFVVASGIGDVKRQRHKTVAQWAWNTGRGLRGLGLRFGA